MAKTTQQSRTTANEPIDAIDPGGTKPKPRGKNAEKPKQTVESGDRNDHQTSTIAPTTPKPN